MKVVTVFSAFVVVLLSTDVVVSQLGYRSEFANAWSMVRSGNFVPLKNYLTYYMQCGDYDRLLAILNFLSANRACLPPRYADGVDRVMMPLLTDYVLQTHGHNPYAELFQYLINRIIDQHQLFRQGIPSNIVYYLSRPQLSGIYKRCQRNEPAVGGRRMQIYGTISPHRYTPGPQRYPGQPLYGQPQYHGGVPSLGFYPSAVPHRYTPGLHGYPGHPFYGQPQYHGGAPSPGFYPSAAPKEEDCIATPTAETDTEPEKAGTEQEEGGTEPEEAGTEPGEASTEPEEADTEDLAGQRKALATNSREVLEELKRTEGVLAEYLLGRGELEPMLPEETHSAYIIRLLKMYQKDAPENIRSEIERYLKVYTFKFSDLLSHLPNPTYDYEKEYYAQLELFFSGENLHKYFIEIVTSDSDMKTMLKHMLEKIVADTSLSHLHNAALYYLSCSLYFDYSVLIPLIPMATGEKEQKLYNVITEYLKGKEIYHYMHEFYPYRHLSDLNKILIEVFKLTASIAGVPESIQVAAKYYMTTFRPLTVSIERKVSKSLDLNSIFADSFDFSEFTKAQFEAFERFFKYVSVNAKSQAMAFDQWDEQSTKGDFTRAFFKYLMEQEGVPEDVLADMRLLQPLIQITGAALNRL